MRCKSGGNTDPRFSFPAQCAERIRSGNDFATKEMQQTIKIFFAEMNKIQKEFPNPEFLDDPTFVTTTRNSFRNGLDDIKYKRASAKQGHSFSVREI